MKVKNAVSIALLLFVAASVVYLVAGESLSRNGPEQAGAPGTVAEPTLTRVATEPIAAPQEPAATAEEAVKIIDEPAESAETPREPQHKLTAYYFHRTQRCPTCLNMEAYAEAALREGLADAFASGELEWLAINVEQPQHEHFIEEYGLTASALVMALSRAGAQTQWKSLERVWELVADESEFKEYVRDEALAYLGEGR